SFLYQRDKLSLLAILLKSPRLSSFASEAEQAESLNKQLTGLLTEIKIKKQILEENRDQLSQKKNELEDLNVKQNSQKISLSGSKIGKGNLLTETKGEEVRYQELLREVEKKQTEFFNELQRLENEAVESGAFIVHVTADNVPPKGNVFRWPYDDYFLTQGFGYTTYARRGAYGGAPHNGIDFASGLGTPIRSIGSGAILTSGFNSGFGNWVAVRHDNGLVSVYAHMGSPTGLANSTPVSNSSIIGYEGSTGNSTGSHLHLSLYRDFFTYLKNDQLYFNYFDGTLNPLDYLP
ncbi:MAG: peptidoglycan DD-metalloendopeptidase family protein, partial [Candidatus Paceibacterota bacterium]